jgi:hypothetical protein
MLILTTQDANSIVIWKVQPKVHCNILKIVHPLLSVKVNIISGAVLNIEGIVLLYSTVGGTGPELIVPSKVW